MVSSAQKTIAVLGAGAWGTALANAFAGAGLDVILWGRDAAKMRRMQQTRFNEKRLPDVVLHETVTPVEMLGGIASADIAVLATPTQSTRDMVDVLRADVRSGVPIVITAKGIDRQTGLFPSQIIAQSLPGHPVAILSGPSFASDVARGLPTAVVLAAQEAILAQGLAKTLSGRSLRFYHSTDMRGVELGGAGKNVLAIAAGAAIGHGLGESARAAITARGFAELGRFAKAMGGREQTLMGLSGLGDVVLSCTSSRSRNFAYGEALGRGIAPDEAGRGALAEGTYTAAILVELARKHHVEMPICAAIAAVVAGQIGIAEALDALMTRPLKAE
jgi:glycerol-3-phosphate dehydrogenase (NAD(P)+)